MREVEGYQIRMSLQSDLIGRDFFFEGYLIGRDGTAE